jgi:HEAT repeat protein
MQPWLPRSQPARLLSLLRGELLRAPLRERVFAALVERWGELSPAERSALEGARGPEHHLPEQTWAPPGWQSEQRGALRRLFETRIEVRASSNEEASEDERARWRREALGEDEEAARRALSRLAEEPDGSWRELALRLVETGSPRVRHHVLRLIRKTLPREDTLRAARAFLRDEDASARRMAIRIVCHGKDTEALPAVVELLLDPVAWVRKEALEGLRLQREEAIPWVERARNRARPDQARRLQEALERLGQ